MAYQETIKTVDKMRAYLRDFFVYGYKCQDDFEEDSSRTYDNERKRIDNWLNGYMQSKRDVNGKMKRFISFDSRRIKNNPLHRIWKIKSFTDTYIMLHFYILDILADGKKRDSNTIVDAIRENYLKYFAPAEIVREEKIGKLDADGKPVVKKSIDYDYKGFSEANIRKRLDEYVELGLLQKELGSRNKAMYFCSLDKIDLKQWRNALDFFSEVKSLGVIGSFLLERQTDEMPLHNGLSFKHRYIMHTLESDILANICQAITDKCTLKITANERGYDCTEIVVPIKISIGTQTGRRYLNAWRLADGHDGDQGIRSFRLDYIEELEQLEKCADYDTYQHLIEAALPHIWGVSMGGKCVDPRKKHLEHVELILHISEAEADVKHSLEREKHGGTIKYLGEERYSFTIDVYDSGEMLPWIRNFIGNIESFHSDNKCIEERFWNDITTTMQMYEVIPQREEGEQDGAQKEYE